MKNTDYERMKKRIRDGMKDGTAGRLSGANFQCGVFEKLFKNPVYHRTVKQNLI